MKLTLCTHRKKIITVALIFWAVYLHSIVHEKSFYFFFSFMISSYTATDVDEWQKMWNNPTQYICKQKHKLQGKSEVFGSCNRPDILT